MNERRSAIVVAHPGHELRVFHWMELSRPYYCCLTDGSGGAASSRLQPTTALLKTIDATIGPLYGRFPDKAVYQLLIEGHVDVFTRLARELADFFVSNGVTEVAGDAVEGFNPTHDVCRFVIDGAVKIARARTGRDIRNYDFVVDGAPDASSSAAVRIELDDAALDRKIAAAFTVPELNAEVNLALERFGRRAFAIECLRPTTTEAMIDRFERQLPTYERYGEVRVSQGRYTDVIRYREHVLPVRIAIEAMG